MPEELCKAPRRRGQRCPGHSNRHPSHGPGQAAPGEYSEAMQQIQEYAAVKPHFAKLPLKMGACKTHSRPEETSEQENPWNTPPTSLRAEMGTHANRALVSGPCGTDHGTSLHRGWPFTSPVAWRLWRTRQKTARPSPQRESVPAAPLSQTARRAYLTPGPTNGSNSPGRHRALSAAASRLHSSSSSHKAQTGRPLLLWV